MPSSVGCPRGGLTSVVCRVSWCPSRSITSGTLRPVGVARMTSPSPVQVLTALPSNDSILSPARSPAARAGETCSVAVQVPLAEARAVAFTHGIVDPTWAVVPLVSRPIAPATRNSRTRASTNCMNEPAHSTISR